MSVRLVPVLAFLTSMSLAACGTKDIDNTGAPVVLAAASLEDALTDAAGIWAADGHSRPVLSFAATSALARQLDNGAPGDLFIAADENWMDHAEEQGLVAPGTRVAFLTNRLVIVAPKDSVARIVIAPGMPLASLLGDGRLALADPDSVPAGRYASAALHALDVWASVEPKLARAENVRAALALVERGAAPLGIVYATDAAAAPKLRVLAEFPADLHPPIVYPLARLKRSDNREAEAFRQFLISAPGEAIFRKYGFGAPGDEA